MTALVTGQLVCGVVARNSTRFVDAVFDAYRRGKCVVLLRGSGDRARIDAFGITEVVDPLPAFGWMQPHVVPRPAASVAQISFTSGTEGEPKGVVLTHGNLADVVQRLNSVMEVTSEIREYVGVPVHYSFGLGRCRAVAAVGGRCFLPQDGFNPIEIRDMLRDGHINAISAVPSLWRVLLKGRSVFGAEVGRVRWIEIGSQSMSAHEKAAIAALFPEAIIVQHYGLTEASRTTFLRIDRETGVRLESVGRTVDQTEIETSIDGRIRIRGPHVARTLIVGGEPGANVDDQGWLETQDIGRIEQGYLFFDGRADDVINCGGIKLSPDTLEENLRARLGAGAPLAVAPIPHPSTGQGVLVVYERGTGLERAKLIEALDAVLQEQGITNRAVGRFHEVDALPRTETGKVQRRALAAAYSAGEEFATSMSAQPTEASTRSAKPDAAASAALGPNGAQVLEVWQEVLGIDSVDPDKNFYEHGGDSLTALIAVMEMSRRKVPNAVSQGMLRGLTVRETVALMTSGDDAPREHTLASDELRASMTINVARGALVLVLVFAHTLPGILERLPASIRVSNEWLMALFFLGTPAFVFIYGLSVGYALYPSYLSSPQRFAVIVRRTAVWLGAGMLVDGTMRFAGRVASGEPAGATMFATSYYSVINFYLLVTLTLPFWFRVLSRARQPASAALLLAACAVAIHRFVFEPLAGLPVMYGALELARLIISAKYAYFHMLAGMLGGVAVGLWFSAAVKERRSVLPMLSAGIASLLTGLVIADYAGMRWVAEMPSEEFQIVQYFVYPGVDAIGLYLIFRVLAHYDRFGRFAKLLPRMLATFGILALPIYVGHIVARPLKIALNLGVGLGASLSLLIAGTLFVGSIGYLYRKVYRASFA